MVLLLLVRLELSETERTAVTESDSRLRLRCCEGDSVADTVFDLVAESVSEVVAAPIDGEMLSDGTSDKDSVADLVSVSDAVHVDEKEDVRDSE